MAINSNRKFRSRETGRRYEVINRHPFDINRDPKGHKYEVLLFDPEKDNYCFAVDAWGNAITGNTIKDVQRRVNSNDYMIKTFDQWLYS